MLAHAFEANPEANPVRHSIHIAVGPEGGWTAEELALFRSAGWQSVGLGPRILRAETAAIAALAIIGAESA
jgi:16S rRNA (uracil1498-N3)-methyltransferase